MNSQEMYEKMKSRLEKIVPDVELRIKAEIAVEIEELKVQKTPSSLVIIIWNRPCSIPSRILPVTRST